MQTAYKIWLEQEQKTWHSRRENISLHLKLIHTELVHKVNYLWFQFFDRQVREEVKRITQSHHKTQVKKLKRLAAEVNAPDDNKIEKLDKCQFKFSPRIVNKTDVEFSNEEAKLLEKGLKYSPNFHSKKDLELLAVNTELALKSVENLEQFHKHLIAKIFDNKKFKVHNSTGTKNNDRTTINNIKQKIENNHLIICKADKGNTITILTKMSTITKL